MDLRVRRRDLKVGKIFICKTEGSTHPMHGCPAGEPVIVKYVYKNKMPHISGMIPAVVCIFVSEFVGLTSHAFRLCDLRKLTPEEWGI